MRIVLDVENTITKREGKTFLDPFEPGNILVQVGLRNVDNPEQCYVVTLDHVEQEDTTGKCRAFIQRVLDKTKLLIMHNAQHDLMWMWECGFKYDGAIYDTMLAEYLLARGIRQTLSLEGIAERRKLEVKKDDTLKNYFKEGYNTNEIPLSDLSLYLRADLNATSELFVRLEKDYARPCSSGLQTLRDNTFDTCKSLTRMYMSGFRVDRQALRKVREDYEKEKESLLESLYTQVREFMGATPINIHSPEQLSMVLYGIKVKDKKAWKETEKSVVNKYISEEGKYRWVNNFTQLYKTKAIHCRDCKGTGRVHKIKKDGTPFARSNKCIKCESRGYLLENTQEIASLNLVRKTEFITANGYATSKEAIDYYLSRKRDMTEDKFKFLRNIKRLNAVSSYLSSFVEGIEINTKNNGFLHVGLTQHITATGRFSGRNPNMQNMPRGNTFPIKKVFVSRWAEGHILECDFAQLEFRVAAHLSNDPVAIEEINTGYDVHAYTASVIGCSRTAAKEHTFAPLFGSSGYGKSKNEKKYYKQFTEKYEGIASWHAALGEEVLETKKLVTPTGRQFSFPEVERRDNGQPTFFTKIKNYPVQSVATGDIVPIILIEIENRLKSLHSRIVNSVHDSMVIDVHPHETNTVVSIIKDLNNDMVDIIDKKYAMKMRVPLVLDVALGKNWLDVKEV